jgi:hypothetical protein
VEEKFWSEIRALVNEYIAIFEKIKLDAPKKDRATIIYEADKEIINKQEYLRELDELYNSLETLELKQGFLDYHTTAALPKMKENLILANRAHKNIVAEKNAEDEEIARTATKLKELESEWRKRQRRKNLTRNVMIIVAILFSLFITILFRMFL